MLTMVTLTGADNSVTPQELLDISKEYPFVEWGILFGDSKQGDERFPSEQWVDQLTKVADGTNMQLSAHICDAYLHAIFHTGLFPLKSSYFPMFQRCQLNFHGQKITDAQRDAVVEAFTSSIQLPSWRGEVIVQLDGVNNSVLDDLLARGVNASGLYDQSHGAGIKPQQWPIPNPKWKTGFAGGIGPDTIEADYRAIRTAAYTLERGREFWIDMERKLRSVAHAAIMDEFDLSKCRVVLKALDRYFKPGPDCLKPDVVSRIFANETWNPEWQTHIEKCDFCRTMIKASRPDLIK